MHKTLKSFTLLEVLVAIGVFSLLALVVIPFTVTSLRTSSAKNLAIELSSIIFEAQQSAYSGKNNKAYGVKFNLNSYNYFIGSSFATNESFDTTNLDSRVVLTLNLSGGATEIVFLQGEIKPSSFGTITVTDDFTSYLVRINEEGFTDFVKI